MGGGGGPQQVASNREREREEGGGRRWAKEGKGETLSIYVGVAPLVSKNVDRVDYLRAAYVLPLHRTNNLYICDNIVTYFCRVRTC